MSTLNVGAMAAKLGLDPSEFLDKMKGVEGFSSASGQRIAAEMKRTARDGAEGFRVFDEVIGLHLNRPLTRLLVETFPALGEAFQTALGGIATGAVGFAVVELFEEMSKKIDKATEAQEKFREATRKVGTTFDEAMNTLEKASQLAGLTGLNRKLFEIDSAAVEQSRKLIDGLADAMMKANAAAASASGPWNEFLQSVGSAMHQVFSRDTTLKVEQVSKDFKELVEKLDDLKSQDPLDRTRQSAEFLKDNLKRVNEELEKLQNAKPTIVVDQFAPKGFEQFYSHSEGGPDKAQIEAVTKERDNLQNLLKIQTKSDSNQSKLDAAAATADALERAKKLADDILNLYRDIGQTKFFAVDPFSKISGEIGDLRIKAENDFHAISMAGASALELRTAGENLDAYVKKLDEALTKARQDADIKKAFAALPPATSTGPLPSLAAPAAVPTLQIPQAHDLTILDAMKKGDANTTFAETVKLLNQIETPAQKYAVALEEIGILTHKGIIDNAQAAAAIQALGEQYDKAQLHIKALQEDLVKLLDHSTSAGDGMKAFWKQLEIDAGEKGKFAFATLNQAVHGFEDTLASAIVNGTRNWKQEWASVLKELETSFLKFGITNLIANIGKEGIFAKLGKMLGGIGAAGANPAAAATSGAPMDPMTFAGFFAEGGDISPNHSFISGEAGPEEVSLGTSGAHVKPLGGGGSGGTHHYYDMRGAVVTDDLLRKAEAAQMFSASEQRSVSRSVSTMSEINARRRPGT